MLKQQKGFSLIELVVVLGVIAILLAVSAPFLKDWLMNASYREVTQEVFQVLKQARSDAVGKNRQFRVRVDIAQRKYIFQEGNNSSSSTDWQPDEAVATNWVVLPATVVLKSKSDCSGSGIVNYIFNPNGTAQIKPQTDPSNQAEVEATGFICVMDAKDTSAPARFVLSVPHTDTTAPDVISNTGRVIIQ